MGAPKHMLAGAVHPMTSGFIIWKTFLWATPYDYSHKWAKLWNGKLDHMPTVINVAAILAALPWQERMNNVDHFGWLYKRGKILTIYGADYDGCMNFQEVFSMFKNFMKKEDYDEMIKEKWQPNGNESVRKNYKNLRFAMFYNSNHL